MIDEPDSVGGGARGSVWVVLQMALLAVIAGVAAFGPRWGGLRDVRVAVAVVLIGVGVVVGLAAARSLGRALTPFPRPRPDAPLTRTGPYRWVRHPMYSALLALSLGGSIAGSPWALLPTVTLAIVLDLKARREERWLLEVHPEYAAHCAAVRWRFLPGVR